MQQCSHEMLWLADVLCLFAAALTAARTASAGPGAASWPVSAAKHTTAQAQVCAALSICSDDTKQHVKRTLIGMSGAGTGHQPVRAGSC